MKKPNPTPEWFYIKLPFFKLVLVLIRVRLQHTKGHLGNRNPDLKYRTKKTYLKKEITFISLRNILVKGDQQDVGCISKFEFALLISIHMQMAHTSILPLPEHFLSSFQLSQFSLTWFTSFLLPKSKGRGGNHSASEPSLLREVVYPTDCNSISFSLCFIGVEKKKEGKREILHKQPKVD